MEDPDSKSFFDVLINNIIDAMMNSDDDVFSGHSIVRVRKSDYLTNFACRKCGEAARSFIIWGDGESHPFNYPVRVFLLCPKCGSAQAVTRDTTIKEAESDSFPFETYKCFSFDSCADQCIANTTKKCNDTANDDDAKVKDLTSRLEEIAQNLALLNARLTDLESKALFPCQTKADNRPAHKSEQPKKAPFFPDLETALKYLTDLLNKHTDK